MSPPKVSIRSNTRHVVGIDATTDEAGENLHVARLVALHAWARELKLPAAQLTYTVLENPDPGAAIIEHAAHVRADHILMGAHSHSVVRRYLGTVSGHVVAQAPCSVTVIRQGGVIEPAGLS